MKSVSKLLKLIRALFPSRLPVGVTEFNAWADDIMAMAKSPNNDSVRFALAAMIVNSGDTEAYISKMFFVLQLRKSMSKQIASFIMYDAKQKQQDEARKAAEESQKASSLEQQS